MLFLLDDLVMYNLSLVTRLSILENSRGLTLSIICCKCIKPTSYYDKNIRLHDVNQMLSTKACIMNILHSKYCFISL